jgi:hypothetical protein
MNKKSEFSHFCSENILIAGSIRRAGCCMKALCQAERVEAYCF